MLLLLTWLPSADSAAAAAASSPELALLLLLVRLVLLLLLLPCGRPAGESDRAAGTNDLAAVLPSAAAAAAAPSLSLSASLPQLAGMPCFSSRAGEANPGATAQQLLLL